MDDQVVGFHLEWRILPTKDGWIGFSTPLGMLVDGPTMETLMSRTEKLVDFFIDTFDRNFTEEQLREYLDRHQARYFLAPADNATIEQHNEVRMSRAYQHVR